MFRHDFSPFIPLPHYLLTNRRISLSVTHGRRPGRQEPRSPVLNTLSGLALPERLEQVLFASAQTCASAERYSATSADRSDCAGCVGTWRPITRMILKRATTTRRSDLIGHRPERDVVWRKSHMWRGLTHHGNMGLRRSRRARCRACAANVTDN